MGETEEHEMGQLDEHEEGQRDIHEERHEEGQLDKHKQGQLNKQEERHEEGQLDEQEERHEEGQLDEHKEGQKDEQLDEHKEGQIEKQEQGQLDEHKEGYLDAHGERHEEGQLDGPKEGQKDGQDEHKEGQEEGQLDKHKERQLKEHEEGHKDGQEEHEKGQPPEVRGENHLGEAGFEYMEQNKEEPAKINDEDYIIGETRRKTGEELAEELNESITLSDIGIELDEFGIDGLEIPDLADVTNTLKGLEAHEKANSSERFPVGTHVLIKHGSDELQAVVVQIPEEKEEDFSECRKFGIWTRFFKKTNKKDLLLLEEKTFFVIFDDIIGQCDEPSLSVIGSRFFYKF